VEERDLAEVVAVREGRETVPVDDHVDLTAGKEVEAVALLALVENDGARFDVQRVQAPGERRGS
jgi:hypothetical protein